MKIKDASQSDVITHAATIAAEIDRRALMLADDSRPYHLRLVAAISLLRDVSHIRDALIDESRRLSSETGRIANANYSPVPIQRGAGVPTEVRPSLQGVPFDEGAIATLNQQVRCFEVAEPMLRRACGRAVSAARELAAAWGAWRKTRAGKRPMRNTSDLASFVLAYVSDRNSCGQLPRQELYCGLTDRKNWTRPTAEAISAGKLVHRLNLRRESPIVAPSMKRGRELTNPFCWDLPIARRYSAQQQWYSRNGGSRVYLPDVIRARYAHLYPTSAVVAHDPSAALGETCLLPALRSGGCAAGARWTRMMIAKHLLSDKYGVPVQVAIGEPQALPPEIESGTAAHRQPGYTIRVMRVVLPYRANYYGAYTARETWAIMLLGPEAHRVTWAHEDELTIETVNRVKARWEDEFRQAREAEERQRRWRMTEEELRQEERKRALTLVCRARRIERFTFNDSRQAGNCAPGTEEFMRNLGITSHEISGPELARRWYRCGRIQTVLFSRVVDYVERQQAQQAQAN